MIFKNYSFSASAKTITFNEAISLEGITTITNLADNVLIYQFNNPSLGATLSSDGKVLTLAFDTTSMSDSDKLQIGYGVPSQQALNLASEETLSFLKFILQLLKPLGITTGAGSNRLSVDVNAVTGTIGTVTTVTGVTTVTTVTTVSTLSNISQVGGVNSFCLMKDASMNTFANLVRSRIT